MVATIVSHSRYTKRRMPSMPASLHRISASDGAKNSIASRGTSTPSRAKRSPGETTFPFDFDIVSPCASATMPWWTRRLAGSSTGNQPASNSTLVKKRKYRRCPVACSSPPM